MVADRRLSIVTIVNAIGGSGLSGLELSTAYARRGHRVHVVTYPETSLPDQWQHPRLHLSPVEPIFIGSLPHPAVVLTMVSAVVNIARRESVDAIHAHYAVTHGEVAILSRDAIAAQINLTTTSQRSRQPVAIVTCRGTDISIFAADPRTAPGLRHILQSADAVTYVSTDLRQRSMEMLGVGAEASVIPNFVPQLVDTEADLAATPRMPNAGCVFVHVSTFRPIKRVSWMVEAFAQASRSLPTGAVRLALIGAGPTVQHVRSTAIREGVDDLVTFLGMVPPGQVRQLVRQADVAMMASDAEGCPRAVLEAMAEGKPVVATDVGGINNLVLDGKTGLLCPPGNLEGYAGNLLRLAQHPRLRMLLGEGARARAETMFSPDAVTSRYEQVIADAVDRTQRYDHSGSEAQALRS